MTPTVTMRPTTQQGYDACRARAVPLAAEDLVRVAGLRDIALNVFGRNSRAEALYRSLGHATAATQLSKPVVEQP